MKQLLDQANISTAFQESMINVFLPEKSKDIHYTISILPIEYLLILGTQCLMTNWDIKFQLTGKLVWKEKKQQLSCERDPACCSPDSAFENKV